LNLKDPFATIDVNLEDLQAAAEACSRASGEICLDAMNADNFLRGIHTEPLLEPLLKRAGELGAAARDQRGALRQLREGIMRLKQEFTRLSGGVKGPRVSSAADRRRR
jgi:hypothetical protein